jgi:hypothetical protein
MCEEYLTARVNFWRVKPQQEGHTEADLGCTSHVGSRTAAQQGHTATDRPYRPQVGRTVTGWAVQGYTAAGCNSGQQIRQRVCLQYVASSEEVT